VSAPERREVGVVAEWRALDNPWASGTWRVTEVLPGPASVAPWTVLHEDARSRRYFAGNAELLLYPLETETLKHNIEGEQPAVYVFLRPCDPAPGVALLGATVCAGEAGAHTDSGSDLVEAVPMPAEILRWVVDFVTRHHADRPEYRRERDKWTRTVA
jgi:hypothetical protein